MAVRIVGTGKYIPPGFETTATVAERLGLSTEDILHKTGIEKRHLAGDESASSMAHKALESAITKSGIAKDEIDGVIVATFTGDYLYPSTALKLVQTLGLKAGIAFDLMANCAGMQVAMENARCLLQGNPSLRVIAVVGLAKQSPFVDPFDENSAYFFGDAASVVLLRRSEAEAEAGGLMPSYFTSNTKNYEVVRLRGGGSSFPHSPALFEQDSKALYYEHTGLGVWKEVVVELPKIIRRAMDDLGWTVNDLDLILFHQANLRLIEYCMARLRVPMSKTINNVQQIGNTAEASLGTVMDEAFDAGWFAPGKKVLLASVGAGFVYTATPYYIP